MPSTLGSSIRCPTEWGSVAVELVSKVDRGKSAKLLAPYGPFGVNWLGRGVPKLPANDYIPQYTASDASIRRITGGNQ